MNLPRPGDTLVKRRVDELSAKPPEELTITDWQDIVAFWKKEAERERKNADYWQSMASLRGAAALLGLAGQLPGGMKLKRGPGRPRNPPKPSGEFRGILSDWQAEPEKRKRGAPRKFTDEQEKEFLKLFENKKQRLSDRSSAKVSDMQVARILIGELDPSLAQYRLDGVARKLAKIVSKYRRRHSQAH